MRRGEGFDTATSQPESIVRERRAVDLRHSGVTLALNAGLPGPEVARRAGHSVEVLLRVYAGCIDDRVWNTRIDAALGAGET